VGSTPRPGGAFSVKVERARGSQPLTAQLFRDFLRNVTRPFNVFRFKRDRGDSRMSTAPYSSASVARLCFVESGFHGFEPTETFERVGDTITLTE